MAQGQLGSSEGDQTGRSSDIVHAMMVSGAVLRFDIISRPPPLGQIVGQQLHCMPLTPHAGQASTSTLIRLCGT